MWVLVSSYSPTSLHIWAIHHHVSCPSLSTMNNKISSRICPQSAAILSTSALRRLRRVWLSSLPIAWRWWCHMQRVSLLSCAFAHSDALSSCRVAARMSVVPRQRRHSRSSARMVRMAGSLGWSGGPLSLDRFGKMEFVR